MKINGYTIKPEADLSGADLSGAFLNSINFSGTNLCGADLSNTYLTFTDFQGANLYGTDLSGANLLGAKGIIQFGPVGYHGRIGYAVRHSDEKVMIQLGCFWGDLEEACEAIQRKYGKDSAYEQLIRASANAIT